MRGWVISFVLVPLFVLIGIVMLPYLLVTSLPDAKRYLRIRSM